MNFYSLFSNYYDEVFPVSSEMENFIAGRLKGSEVLNIGCATGNLEMALSHYKLDITGIDIDENMIKKARKKAEEISNVRFLEGDMTKLETYFSPGSFSNVLCVGNTLAHLRDMEEISRFFLSVKKLLKSEGRFIIQIMNYDRIITNNTLRFPTVKTPSVSFERSYTFEKDHVLFHTTISDGNQIFENTVPLYPLRREELENALQKEGFRNLTFYGNYAGETYAPDSYHTIVYCQKSS